MRPPSSRARSTVPATYQDLLSYPEGAWPPNLRVYLVPSDTLRSRLTSQHRPLVQEATYVERRTVRFDECCDVIEYDPQNLEGKSWDVWDHSVSERGDIEETTNSEMIDLSSEFNRSESMNASESRNRFFASDDDILDRKWQLLEQAPVTALSAPEVFHSNTDVVSSQQTNIQSNDDDLEVEQASFHSLGDSDYALSSKHGRRQSGDRERLPKDSYIALKPTHSLPSPRSAEVISMSGNRSSGLSIRSSYEEEPIALEADGLLDDSCLRSAPHPSLTLDSLAKAMTDSSDDSTLTSGTPEPNSPSEDVRQAASLENHWENQIEANSLDDLDKNPESNLFTLEYEQVFVDLERELLGDLPSKVSNDVGMPQPVNPPLPENGVDLNNYQLDQQTSVGSGVRKAVDPDKQIWKNATKRRKSSLLRRTSSGKRPKSDDCYGCCKLSTKLSRKETISPKLFGQPLPIASFDELKLICEDLRFEDEDATTCADYDMEITYMPPSNSLSKTAIGVAEFAHVRFSDVEESKSFNGSQNPFACSRQPAQAARPHDIDDLDEFHQPVASQSNLSRDTVRRPRHDPAGGLPHLNAPATQMRKSSHSGEGKVWRSIRRPSDTHSHSAQIKEYASQMKKGKGTKGQGKCFIKMLGISELSVPLPKPATFFTCTINNSIHFVTTAARQLSRECEIDQEFEIVDHPSLELAFVFKVRRDPHIITQMKSLANPPPRPPKPPTPPPSIKVTSPRSNAQSKMRALFGASRKPKQILAATPIPSPAPTLNKHTPPVEDNLARYLQPDGTLGQSFISFKDVAERCDKKMFETKVPLIGQKLLEHGTNSKRKVVSQQIGQLALQVFRLPRVPALPAEQLPQSMADCQMGLLHANWHKGTYLDGTLTQLGGDCISWKRRRFRIVGSNLIAFNNVTRKPTVSIDLTQAVSVQRDLGEGKDDFDDGVNFGIQHSFRLLFGDKCEIAFFADCAEEKDKWIDVLVVMVGHIPPNPLWAELVSLSEI